MSNAAEVIWVEPSDPVTAQAPTRPTSQKVEAHMLSIASILFDALSEIPVRGNDRLDIFDSTNTSAMIALSASLE